MKLVLTALTALVLLGSCGSKSDELAEEEPLAGPDGDGSEGLPRLIIPPVPVADPGPMATNPFRVPEVSGDLPEEETLLSRPINSPAPGGDLNTQ